MENFITPKLKINGYSLVSVMVALTAAMIVMTGLTRAYIGAYKSSKFSNSGNLMTVQADLTLAQMSEDIGRSGIFGCYNLRTQGNIAPASVSTHNIIGAGVFESANGGLIAFPSPASAQSEANSPLGSISLDSNSQILKVQYGTGFALIEPPVASPVTSVTFHQPDYMTVSGGAFTALGNTSTPNQLDTTGATGSSLYALASCSRLDLVQGTLSGNALTINAAYNISTTVNPMHDNGSLLLMNAKTRYYYIATVNGVSGLYVNQMQTDGSFSGSLLLLANASNLTFSFQTVNVATSTRNNAVATSAMTAGDWPNVTAVNIAFNYQSAESVTDSQQKLQLQESATVAVLSPGTV